MMALEELPNGDKDLLLPVIGLRRWVGSHGLSSSLTRIEDAFGDRPLVIELADYEAASGKRQPVHDSLDELRDAASGYSNWCEFVAEHSNFIPALQTADPTNLAEQAARFADLGRGVVIRLPEFLHTRAGQIADVLCEKIDPHEMLFIIDYERQSRLILNQQLQALRSIRQIRAAMPGAHVAVSASSFPESFVGATAQDIYERQFYNGLKAELGSASLIYSDRGSARAERQQGGGGSPAPRIDYATHAAWTFFREECDDGVDRLPYYRDAAIRVMGAAEWDPNLMIWGSQLIARTALEDPSAIASPAKSTAARINIHLHRQIFHDNPSGLYDTEDNWDD